MLGGLAGHHDELQDRGGPLLDRQSLALHLLGKLGERRLDAVVDVDGVDVGVAAEREADVQHVAAVVAGGALHVEHLVDAEHLGLDRLRHRGFHDFGGGAGIDRGDHDLRGHDVRELRDGDAHQRERAGDDRHEGDDDREPRAVDEGR